MVSVVNLTHSMTMCHLRTSNSFDHGMRHCGRSLGHRVTMTRGKGGCLSSQTRKMPQESVHLMARKRGGLGPLTSRSLSRLVRFVTRAQSENATMVTELNKNYGIPGHVEFIEGKIGSLQWRSIQWEGSWDGYKNERL